MLEETNEVIFSGTGEIVGLGPVGASKDKQIGFHLHSVLAVRWPSKPDQTQLYSPSRCAADEHYAFFLKPRPPPEFDFSSGNPAGIHQVSSAFCFISIRA